MLTILVKGKKEGTPTGFLTNDDGNVFPVFGGKYQPKNLERHREIVQKIHDNTTDPAKKAKHAEYLASLDGRGKQEEGKPAPSEMSDSDKRLHDLVAKHEMAYGLGTGRTPSQRLEYLRDEQRRAAEIHRRHVTDAERPKWSEPTAADKKRVEDAREAAKLAERIADIADKRLAHRRENPNATFVAPTLPHGDYDVTDKDKIALSFSKADFDDLEPDLKERLRRFYNWSPKSSSWISKARSSDDNAHRIAVEAGFSRPEKKDIKQIERKLPEAKPVEGLGEGEWHKASAEDVNPKTALAAYQNTSWTPEERAAREGGNHVEAMNYAVSQLEKLASTPEKQALLKSMLEDYRPKLLEKHHAYLASRSRLASSAITGPSNFPVQQMERRGEIVHNKLGDYLQFQDDSINRMRKILTSDLDGGPIMSHHADAIPRLQEKLAKAEKYQESAKALNKIAKSSKMSDEEKIAKIVSDLGFSEDTARKALTPDAFGNIGVAAYSLTNNNANIRRIKEQIADIQKRYNLEKGEGVTMRLFMLKGGKAKGSPTGFLTNEEGNVFPVFGGNYRPKNLEKHREIVQKIHDNTKDPEKKAKHAEYLKSLGGGADEKRVPAGIHPDHAKELRRIADEHDKRADGTGNPKHAAFSRSLRRMADGEDPEAVYDDEHVRAEGQAETWNSVQRDRRESENRIARSRGRRNYGGRIPKVEKSEIRNEVKRAKLVHDAITSLKTDQKTDAPKPGNAASSSRESSELGQHIDKVVRDRAAGGLMLNHSSTKRAAAKAALSAMMAKDPRRSAMSNVLDKLTLGFDGEMTPESIRDHMDKQAAQYASKLSVDEATQTHALYHPLAEHISEDAAKALINDHASQYGSTFGISNHGKTAAAAQDLSSMRDVLQMVGKGEGEGAKAIQEAMGKHKAELAKSQPRIEAVRAGANRAEGAPKNEGETWRHPQHLPPSVTKKLQLTDTSRYGINKVIDGSKMGLEGDWATNGHWLARTDVATGAQKKYWDELKATGYSEDPPNIKVVFPQTSGGHEMEPVAWRRAGDGKPVEMLVSKEDPSVRVAIDSGYLRSVMKATGATKIVMGRSSGPLSPIALEDGRGATVGVVMPVRDDGLAARDIGAVRAQTQAAGLEVESDKLPTKASILQGGGFKGGASVERVGHRAAVVKDGSGYDAKITLMRRREDGGWEHDPMLSGIRHSGAAVVNAFHDAYERNPEGIKKGQPMVLRMLKGEGKRQPSGFITVGGGKEEGGHVIPVFGHAPSDYEGKITVTTAGGKEYDIDEDKHEAIKAKIKRHQAEAAGQGKLFTERGKPTEKAKEAGSREAPPKKEPASKPEPAKQAAPKEESKSTPQEPAKPEPSPEDAIKAKVDAKLAEVAERSKALGEKFKAERAEKAKKEADAASPEEIKAYLEKATDAYLKTRPLEREKAEAFRKASLLRGGETDEGPVTVKPAGPKEEGFKIPSKEEVEAKKAESTTPKEADPKSRESSLGWFGHDQAFDAMGKDGKPVDRIGSVLGHFGVSKHGANHVITHIPTGAKVASFKTQMEAKTFTEAMHHDSKSDWGALASPKNVDLSYQNDISQARAAAAKVAGDSAAYSDKALRGKEGGANTPTQAEQSKAIIDKVNSDTADREVAVRARTLKQHIDAYVKEKSAKYPGRGPTFNEQVKRWKRSAEDEWKGAILKEAEKNRLPNATLKAWADAYGEESIPNTFRGKYERGAGGHPGGDPYEPTGVRKKNDEERAARVADRKGDSKPTIQERIDATRKKVDSVTSKTAPDWALMHHDLSGKEGKASPQVKERLQAFYDKAEAAHAAHTHPSPGSDEHVAAVRKTTGQEFHKDTWQHQTKSARDANVMQMRQLAAKSPGGVAALRDVAGAPSESAVKQRAASLARMAASDSKNRERAAAMKGPWNHESPAAKATYVGGKPSVDTLKAMVNDIQGEKKIENRHFPDKAALGAILDGAYEHAHQAGLHKEASDALEALRTSAYQTYGQLQKRQGRTLEEDKAMFAAADAARAGFDFRSAFEKGGKHPREVASTSQAERAQREKADKAAQRAEGRKPAGEEPEWMKVGRKSAQDATTPRKQK